MVAKVPAERRDEVKAAFWEPFGLDGDAVLGEPAVRSAHGRIDAFARRYQREFPSAVKCLLTDRQALTAYLRFPAEHWRRIRRANLIERTFRETRRRVKSIGRLPGEASFLSLVWAGAGPGLTGLARAHLHASHRPAPR